MIGAKDMDLNCETCGVTPHRFRPSPEAGPHWRCSSCGEVAKWPAGLNAPTPVEVDVCPGTVGS